MAPDFFSSAETHSVIKRNIVTKYFDAWATIMSAKTRIDRIAYIDLFCGPGKYSDGTESTPMFVLKKCLSNANIKNKIRLVFNDSNPEFINQLKENLSTISGYDSLIDQITYNNAELTSQNARNLFDFSMIPSFSFVDPFGYNGVCFGLIKGLVSDFGCDCVFFFNYNRINAAIFNPFQFTNMTLLFGEENLINLRKELTNEPNQAEKENIIMNNLASIFDEINLFVLPFRFNRAHDRRTSHYIVFLSKHKLGYGIMKNIMAKESASSHDGVPYLEYMPITNPKYNLLYPYSMTLEDLKNDLIKQYSGETISVIDIFDSHNIGKPFILKNYKDVIKSLESNGTVKVTDPLNKKRRRGTLADRLLISFV